MEADGRYMMRNNYRYSVTLLDWCQDNDVPFLYASSAAVYGGGNVFREERAFEAPLNVYGYSKFLFDQYVRRMLPRAHRADRRLPLLQRLRPARAAQGPDGVGGLALSAASIASDGRVRLFEGSGGYAAGEQRRDFVSVDDVVKVNLDFLDHPRAAAASSTWAPARRPRSTTVAVATINACRAAAGEPPRTLAELVAAGAITYVPFPPALVGKYQSFTEADLTRLRTAGYRRADARRSTKVSLATSNG